MIFLTLFICFFFSADAIVGGNEFHPPGTKSFMAAVMSRGTSTHYCGATLIHPQWLLTAAHCVSPQNAYDAVFRRHNETDTFSEEGALVAPVLRVIRHPETPAFDPEAVAKARSMDPSRTVADFDFALLELADPVRFKPARPYLGENQFVDEHGTTYGWGATSQSGPQSDVLKGVSGLRVFSNLQCSQVLFPYEVTDAMICMGGEEGKDACGGDSGGYAGIDNTDLFIGITSWGLGCAQDTLPGVYSRVSAAADFIREYVPGYA